ncbi:MAG: hypothetical protein JXL97_18175 [Bacteroidales bacterium]|nr:hypothetical protein [Bacteroidales bacterium]
MRSLLLGLVVLFIASCGQPEAYFTADKYICNINESVQLQNQCNNYKRIEWSFGATEDNPTITFEYPGYYDVAIIAYPKFLSGIPISYAEQFTVTTDTHQKFAGVWVGEKSNIQKAQVYIQIEAFQTSYTFNIKDLIDGIDIQAEDLGDSISIPEQSDDSFKLFSGNGYLENDTLFFEIIYTDGNEFTFKGVRP